MCLSSWRITRKNRVARYYQLLERFWKQNKESGIPYSPLSVIVYGMPLANILRNRNSSEATIAFGIEEVVKLERDSCTSQTAIP